MVDVLFIVFLGFVSILFYRLGGALWRYWKYLKRPNVAVEASPDAVESRTVPILKALLPILAVGVYLNALAAAATLVYYLYLLSGVGR